MKAKATEAGRVMAAMSGHNCVCPTCLNTHRSATFRAPSITDSWCSHACWREHQDASYRRRSKARRRWKCAMKSYGF